MTARATKLLTALVVLAIISLGIYATPQVSGDDSKEEPKSEEATELLKKSGEYFEFKAPAQLNDGFTLTPNGEKSPVKLTKLDASGEPPQGAERSKLTAWQFTIQTKKA